MDPASAQWRKQKKHLSSRRRTRRSAARSGFGLKQRSMRNVQRAWHASGGAHSKEAPAVRPFRLRRSTETIHAQEIHEHCTRDDRYRRRLVANGDGAISSPSQCTLSGRVLEAGIEIAEGTTLPEQHHG